MKRIEAYLEKKLKVDIHYFVKGGFWLSVSQGSVIVIGFITTAILAHYLSETQYGVYKYLINLAIILSAFSLTGIGQSILQATARRYFNFYRESIRVNLIYNLGVVISGTTCATYYFLKENWTLAIGCLAISVLQPLINTYQNSHVFLQGAGKFQQSALNQSIRTLFVSTLSIASLYLYGNVLALFLSYLISNLVINYIVHKWQCYKEYDETPDEKLQEYISYAKHTSIRNVLSAVANRIDTFLIFTQLGAAELATYSIATIIPDQLKGSQKNLSVLLIPKYSQYDDPVKLKKTILLRSVQLFVILGGITLIYIITAPFIFQLFFPKYTDAIFYSQILSLIFLTHVFYLPYSALMVKMQERILYHLSLWSSLFQIGLLLLFIPTMGILGAIVAKLIYRVIFTIVTFVVYFKN